MSEAMAIFVALIPIVPIGTKHVGNETGALTTFCLDYANVPDVEVVVGMLAVVPG